jgi:hypothetical protein
MPWSGWVKDPSGPGDVNTKTTSTSSGGSRTEHLRTEDNAKTGSRDDHSHVTINTDSSGHTTSAGGHGIREGSRK